ncbi:hypothetical protein [Hyphomonas sp.]|uniref:hypothetical protein n=1 Tax=Hyphomonas sp. TaxID=87 RepID=UPI0039190839
MIRSLIISSALAGALTLTACDRVFQRASDPAETAAPEDVSGEDTAVPASAELPVRPESEATGGAIDWEAARRDLASRSSGDLEGSFQVQSGEVAPPVPVFLPSGPVAAQSGDVAIRFQPTDDGYYAWFPGDAYDIIVNGTNVVITAPGGEKAARTEAFNFAPTTSGAQVSFSRYGADYLIEFECKQMVDGMPDCITEEEAVAFARDLAISGTR